MNDEATVTATAGGRDSHRPAGHPTGSAARPGRHDGRKPRVRPRAARRAARLLGLSLAAVALAQPAMEIATAALRLRNVPGPAFPRPATRFVVVAQRPGREHLVDWRLGPVPPGYPARVSDGVTEEVVAAATDPRQEVGWLDARDLGLSQERLLPRLRERIEAGARWVVHDPELGLLAALAPELAADGRARRLEPASPAARQPLHGVNRLEDWPVEDELPADPAFASHGGTVDASGIEGAVVFVSEDGSRTRAVTLCLPLGEGALVYSTIPVREYLRGREDSPFGAFLREVYAPTLAQYAAWGACNEAARVLPLHVDVVPEDEANRITRRGIPVTVYSRSPLYGRVAMDPSALRAGLTGRERSLHRCRRLRDLDGDGVAELGCVFRYERTRLRGGRGRLVLGGRTGDGHPVYAVAPVQVVAQE